MQAQRSRQSHTTEFVQLLLAVILRSPQRVVDRLSTVGCRRRHAMSTQELLEVAERQVLEDEPLQCGVARLLMLLRPGVSRRVHAAQQIGYVRIAHLRHRVARNTQKFRSKITQIVTSSS